MKFKRPSLRRSHLVFDSSVKWKQIEFTSHYIHGLDEAELSKYRRAESCGCDLEFKYIENGFELCTSCGFDGRPEYEEMPNWHGLSTKRERVVYNPQTHMNNKLRPLLRHVDSVCSHKIMAVFPAIFKTFFLVAPERKNFMSYGFVIMKLLHMMGVDTANVPIKMIKTKSKLAQCEKYWEKILSRMKLNLTAC